MLVILTGAGISRESGIETFRDKNGIWTKVRIEDVATPGAFARDPQRVHDFYNNRRKELCGGHINPNAAHEALVKLEREYNGKLLLVTQNVDDLHERAGSRAWIHMHGELLKARCNNCANVAEWKEDLSVETACPRCNKSGGMRPHVVWFEEMPLALDEIAQALRQCRTFVAIGTSGEVYPAAGFVQMAKEAGAQTVELNLEPSRGAKIFHTGMYGPATEVVPAWVESILQAPV